jgi:hypothetical protein
MHQTDSRLLEIERKFFKIRDFLSLNFRQLECEKYYTGCGLVLRKKDAR